MKLSVKNHSYWVSMIELISNLLFYKVEGLVYNGFNCTNGWLGYKSYCYLYETLESPTINWYEARLNCLNYKGNLLSIQDQAENDFIIYQLKITSSLNKRQWIGLNDIQKEDKFEWIDNATEKFLKWRPNEPNGKINENCVEIYSDGWNDLSCDTKLNGFFCKSRAQDINECSELSKYCNWTNSECKNIDGSYICSCKSGWILDEKKNNCIDINECSELSKYCNWTNSECANIDGSYICSCKSGWILDEKKNSCIDINECSELSKYCNWTNSECTNIDGSYICSCKSGWILDEKKNSCIDFDECANLIKLCNLTNSDCINNDGSYNCACKPGWILDKNNNKCIDIDECSSLIDNCSSTDSICINNIGSFNCIKGKWSTWSECSETCGFGYKYSVLNALGSEQSIKRSQLCMNFKCPVDGNWSNWINNKSCTDICKTCFIRKERHCNNPTPTDGGQDCFGINVQHSESDTICKVDGVWTEWSSWSLCNQPCQGGVKTRYRNCSNPVPKYGGLKCNGNDTNQYTCDSKKCNKIKINIGIVFTDEDYMLQYLNPSNLPTLELIDRVSNAIQNLYNKLNKTVSFQLILISLKDGEKVKP
ncbi:fibrillin-1-like isoform X2 [Hydra vulgaris]|uniref:Fibrillin-1-like isoform X2 n=1 Tax=Hydra vulgaris TaxID=6087 RepID=A0ABM4DK09_HYDVU